VSYLVLTIAIALLSFFLAWHYVDIRPRGKVLLRPLVAFGLRSYPGSFARLLNVRLDQLVLVPLVSPAQLAFYAIAVTISQLPQYMADAISARTAGSIIGPERLFLVHRAERYLRLNILTAVMVSIVLAALAPPVIPFVYGHAFDGIVLALVLLLPGAIANSGTQVAEPCLTAIGRPGVTSLAELTALLITGLGLWYALPRYGIAGAAAVSSVAYIYRYGVQLAVLRRYGVRDLVPKPGDFSILLRAIPRRRLRFRREAPH
jgi:O-antigen/teichoic acid export membrane protein